MFMKWWMENLPGGKRKTHLFVPVILALLLAAVPGCALLPDEPEEEVLPEITPPQISQKPEYTVKTATIENTVTGIGKIMSMQEEDLFFTLEEGQSYRVREIYVESGQQVEEGQLIAELDVTDLENQLRSRELEFRNDEIEMKRTLRRANEMSAEELEQQKIEFEQDRTELLELREQIERSKLRAPFSGTIVSLSIERGDSVQAYDTVAVIADLSRLAVAARIDSDDLNKVAVGMEVVVDINAAGQHKGTVSRLPVADEDSNDNNRYDPYRNNREDEDSIEDYMLVELEAFPEVTRGTPLSAKVIIDRKEDAVVIPPSALRTYGGRTYVQVVEEDGSKREVDVKVGQQLSTQVEILEGLEPGQKVVGR